MEIRQISLVVSTHRDESGGLIQFSWKPERLFLPDIASVFLRWMQCQCYSEYFGRL